MYKDRVEDNLIRTRIGYREKDDLTSKACLPTIGL